MSFEIQQQLIAHFQFSFSFIFSVRNIIGALLKWIIRFNKCLVSNKLLSTVLDGYILFSMSLTMYSNLAFSQGLHIDLM